MTTTQRLHFTLGDAVEKMRSAAHLEQEQLANEVGISRSTVSNYERDKSAPPNFRTVQRIAAACGYDPDDPSLKELWEEARRSGCILWPSSDLEGFEGVPPPNGTGERRRAA
jgi:transcriptional regulator with XRE-family HTH domain